MRKKKHIQEKTVLPLILSPSTWVWRAAPSQSPSPGDLEAQVAAPSSGTSAALRVAIPVLEAQDGVVAAGIPRPSDGLWPCAGGRARGRGPHPRAAGPMAMCRRPVIARPGSAGGHATPRQLHPVARGRGGGRDGGWAPGWAACAGDRGPSRAIQRTAATRPVAPAAPFGTTAARAPVAAPRRAGDRRRWPKRRGLHSKFYAT